MSISVFLNGLLAPLYALFDGGFNPSENFGQFIVIAIVSLSLLSVIIKILK